MKKAKAVSILLIASLMISTTGCSGAKKQILAAADEGVDSCWVNFFDPDKLASELNLPENEEILMILDLGYAAEGTGPLANHTKRKPLTETVTYL